MSQAEKTERILEDWEKPGRIHLHGLVGDYDLKEERQRLRSLPRVIRSDELPWKGGPRMFNKTLLSARSNGPQSIYVHLKEFLPGTASQLHGHQNPALMYVLQGKGYDIQDGERIDWQAGDLAVIQDGTVHQHFCISDVPARVLIFKPKSLYMFANLIYQGLVKPADKTPLQGWEGYLPD